MTRANIIIFQDCFPKKVYFELTSSAYPSHVLDSIVRFCTEHIFRHTKPEGQTKTIYNRISDIALRDFVQDLCPSISQVGNPDYFYDIDLITGTLKVWKYKNKWIYAPLDWKEKGWHCCEEKNGRAGYTKAVRGKLLLNMSIFQLEGLTEVMCGEELIKLV